MQKRVLSCGLFVLSLGVPCARSQEAPCTNRKLPVSFRDAQNLPIENISVSDLEAKIKGEPVKFLSLAPDVRPHRIILILDTSGSMGSEASEPPLWNLELSLARHFFEVNRGKAQVALLFFNDRVDEIANFEQGNSAVGEVLGQIAGDRDYQKKHMKGRTALRDAIFQGAQLIDHPTSADAIYVLTDGGDNISKHNARDVDERLAVTSIRLFAVLLQKSMRIGYRSRTPEEITGPQDLAEMTRKSGGEILTAAEWHDNKIALSATGEAKVSAEETLSMLYQTIVQDRLLEIELPFPVARKERWEIKLSEAARHRWKGAQITYPPTLLSCDSGVAGSGRH